jgi:beta-1,4-N-acetylglucosaminyltransferase
MIFITVGNGRFDSLVSKVDSLVKNKKIKDNILIQIGQGNYIPEHCNWFRYKQSLERYYKSADLVICHGGSGTVFELLRMKKRFIAVPNLERTDSHQIEFLKAIMKETNSFVYCKNAELLNYYLEKVKHFRFVLYHQPKCIIQKVIDGFLGENDG